MERLILAALLAMSAALLLTVPVRWLVLRFGVVDQPNHRSSHQVPTPRGGGIALVLSAALAALTFAAPGRDVVTLGLCLLPVVLVSIVDDFRSLSFASRLLVQVGAALAAVLSLDLPVRTLGLPGSSVGLPHWVGLALAVLFVVAYSNFFNFMDGINGIAATQAMLSGSTLAVLLHQAGNSSAAVVAAALAGAAGGFLPHNFPSARIFLGDVGSVTLGFALAILSMIAHASGGVPWPALLLIHGAFLFDAVFTLVKRAVRGENVVRPHREHIYQLLVRGGRSHFAVTLTYSLVSAACCAAGYLYARAGTEGQWAALIVPLLLLWTLAVVVHRRNPTASPVPATSATRSGAS